MRLLLLLAGYDVRFLAEHSLHSFRPIKTTTTHTHGVCVLDGSANNVIIDDTIVFGPCVDVASGELFSFGLGSSKQRNACTCTNVIAIFACAKHVLHMFCVCGAYDAMNCGDGNARNGYSALCFASVFGFSVQFISRGGKNMREC